jgi:hypothetical protein
MAYDYSATVENSIGAEIILMGKALGVYLASIRKHLEDLDIQIMAHSFIELEHKLFELRFSAVGTLYFKTDIAPSL